MSYWLRPSTQSHSVNYARLHRGRRSSRNMSGKKDKKGPTDLDLEKVEKVSSPREKLPTPPPVSENILDSHVEVQNKTNGKSSNIEKTPEPQASGSGLQLLAEQDDESTQGYGTEDNVPSIRSKGRSIMAKRVAKTRNRRGKHKATVGSVSSLQNQLAESQKQMELDRLVFENEKRRWALQEKMLKAKMKSLKRSPKVKVRSPAIKHSKSKKSKSQKKHLDEINNLLDLNNFQGYGEWEDVDSDDSLPQDDSNLTSDSDSESTTSSDSSTRSHRRYRKGRSAKRGKSGIEAKAASRVKDRQMWAHSALQGEFATAETKFNDLSFAKLVAGELEIIDAKLTGSPEVKGRLSLLKNLAYNKANDIETSVVRSMYAAVLRKIELGQSTWRSDFTMTMHQVLVGKMAKVKLGGQAKRATSKKDFGNKKKDNNKLYFCKAFQKNACDVTDTPHKGEVRGQEVQVHHICAKCYLKDREVLGHPESSSACQYFGEF